MNIAVGTVQAVTEIDSR